MYRMCLTVDCRIVLYHNSVLHLLLLLLLLLLQCVFRQMLNVNYLARCKIWCILSVLHTTALSLICLDVGLGN